MTELEKTEQELYDKGIKIIEGYVPKSEAMSIKFNDEQGSKFIVLDRDKLSNSKEERSVLIHEEMHLEHIETMYELDTPISVIKAKERQVEAYIFKKYLPLEKLFKMIYEDKLEIWEIAELLQLSEGLILEAYRYYESNEEWINKKRLTSECIREY